MMSSTAIGITEYQENWLRAGLCVLKNYSKNYSGSYYFIRLLTTLHDN